MNTSRSALGVGCGRLLGWRCLLDGLATHGRVGDGRLPSIPNSPGPRSVVCPDLVAGPCGSVDESRRCAHHWNASADQPIVWRRDWYSIHGNLRAPPGADSLQPNRSPRRQPWEVNGRSIGGLSECRRRSHVGFGNGHSASNQFARVGGREAGVCSRVYRRLPRRNRRRSDLPVLRSAPTGNEIRPTRRPMTGIVAKMTSERRRAPCSLPPRTRSTLRPSWSRAA
jgi:hypothetical protein